MKDIENYTELSSCSLDNGVLVLKLKSDSGSHFTVNVSFYEKGIVRFNYMPSNKAKEISQVSSRPSRKDIAAVQKTEDGCLLAKGEKLHLVIKPDPFQMKIRKKEGEVLWEQARNDLNVGLLSRVPLTSTVKEKGEDNSGSVKAIKDSFALHPDEKILGLGEKFTPLNKRGQQVESWNYDAYGVQTDRSYANVPFMMSSRGYGLYFDTTARMVHKVGSEQNSVDSYTFRAEASNLDYYFIYGPGLRGVLNKYSHLTGYSPQPPDWSFGIWMSRCYYETEDEVREIARRLREKELPCDVINLDGRAWLRHGKQTDFVWDKERFPRPESLIEDLNEDNFQVCLWENPYISESSELYRQAEKKGYLLTDNKGEVYKIFWVPEEFQGLHEPPKSGIVDLTNPEAREWFKDLHRSNLKMGVKVYKTDFGEGIPVDSHGDSGITGRLLHNLYPILYNEAVYEVIQEEQSEGMVWARSGWAGSQRYPVQWGGDSHTSYAGLRGAMRGAISAGLSGIPFASHDVGGFYGEKPSPKLYIRWLQFGLLSSHTRFHGTTPREPWEFGQKAVENYKKYASLRYKLLPYLLNEADKCCRQGVPLMKAMPLYDQNDSRTYECNYQYLLGENLLVAPFYTSADSREIYLPEGSWVDFWSGEIYKGKQMIEYEADLDTIPLFMAENSLIPLGSEAQFVGEKEWDDYRLIMYLRGECSYYLNRSEEEFKACRTKERCFEIEAPASSVNEIELLGESLPAEVKINGREVSSDSMAETERGLLINP